jgi:hypothetical protein
MKNRLNEDGLNIVIDGRIYEPCSLEDRLLYAAFLESNTGKMIRIQEDDEDGTFQVITDEAWDMLQRFGTQGFFDPGEQELTVHGDPEQAAFQVSLGEMHKASPPALGEILIVLLCPKNRVQAILGDLAEQFKSNVENRGVRRANLLYLAQVVRSCPLLVTKIRNTGFWLFVVELGRRWIGS